MAGEVMPPMVVSSNRYFDIEPYGNRLRAADPIKWGSVFPWEFPQNGSKEEEEKFLRAWFSEEEIHVQGGAGDENTPGAGFRFLKQVWYCQAMWNLEQRVPALNEWWWTHSDSAELIHDASMQKYFLDPHVDLKTFFQSAEREMYGEKFLRHVVPLIQKTAKARIEEQDASKKATNGDQTTRAIAPVPDSIATSESPTALTDRESGMPGLTKTSSQPLVAKTKLVSPNSEQLAAATKSALTHHARPYVPSQEFQPSMEPSHSARKRGYSFNKRQSNRGGHLHSRQSFNAQGQEMPSTTFYGPPPETQPAPYDQYPAMPPGSQMGFQSLHTNGGQPAGATNSRNHSAAQYPPFNAPPQYVDSQQQQIIWAPNPFFERGDDQDFHRTVSSEEYPNGGHGRRGGRGHYTQGSRGGRTRGPAGNRGRSFRARSSFGAQGQPPPGFPEQELSRYNSYEFKGSASATKARRGSVISEKNWRSGTDHPQGGQGDFGENTTPRRDTFNYVPAHYIPAPGHAPHRTTSGQFYPSPPSQPWNAELRAGVFDDLPNDPRFHCTATYIGDLCPYVQKLTVFNIPIQVHEDEVFRFFRNFGSVASVTKLPPLPQNTHNQGTDQIAFVVFTSADEARSCFNNKPATWLLDHRPLRVEVPKEYWDPEHKFFRPKKPMPMVMAPVFEPSPRRDSQVERPPALHQSHDSVSTVRGPTFDSAEQQDASGETTPTASVASTPRKRNNQSKRTANKKKKDSRVSSLATEVEHEAARGSEVAAQNQAKDKTASTSTISMKISIPGPQPNDGLPLDNIKVVEKQCSLSEVTERQSTSETSFTPVDTVPTNLHLPGDRSITSADVPAVDAGEQGASLEPDPQTVAEPPITPHESVCVQLPADAEHGDKTFRAGEAKAQAPTKTATDDSDTTNAKPAAMPSATARSARQKADDEPIDDSFHTATGSPSSNISTDTKRQVPNVPTGSSATSKTHVTGPEQVAEQAQESTVVPPMPLPATASTKVPTLTIDTGSPTKAKADNSTDRSASSDSTLIPTAFVTAPNTPFANVKPQTAITPEEAPTAQAKKAEKPKGPSQTESLSLFSNKQASKANKKSKSKKGTLKGKPKELSSAAADSVPEPKASAGGSASVQEAAEGVQRKPEDVKPKVVPANTGVDANTSAATSDAGGSGTVTPSNLDGMPPPTNEPPTKRKGSMFTNIANTARSFLPGQQSQSNRKEKQDHASVTGKSSLTDVKAPEIDTKQQTIPNESFSNFRSGPVVIDNVAQHGDAGSAASAGTGVEDSSIDTLPPSVDACGKLAGAGLGITTGDSAPNNAEGEEAESEPKPAKKKRKSRKNKKKTIDDVDPTREATPQLEEAQSEPDGELNDKHVFRFDLPNPSSPFSFRSSRPDGSPHSVGQATPSSGGSSPMTSRPRKLPSSTSSSAPLLQGKTPSWKRPKRVLKQHDLPDDEKSEGSKSNYTLDASDGTAESSPTAVDRVDTPAELNEGRITELDNVEDEDGNTAESEAVKQSKAKMQELKEKEKRIKREKAQMVKEGEGSGSGFQLVLRGGGKGGEDQEISIGNKRKAG